jgi:tripeptide aminopeptidase
MGEPAVGPSREQIAARLANRELAQEIIDRFLLYVKIDSPSNGEEADKGKCPSTECQFNVAEAVVSELKGMGIEDVRTYPTAHVIAKIPPTPGLEASVPLVLMAHMDTFGGCPGVGIKPIVETNEIGDTVIRSDGTTLLGADDKAGIAIILTTIRHVVKDPSFRHGLIELAFTPDEETGSGATHLDPSWMEGRPGYTVDGLEEPNWMMVASMQ